VGTSYTLESVGKNQPEAWISTITTRKVGLETLLPRSERGTADASGSGPVGDSLYRGPRSTSTVS